MPKELAQRIAKLETDAYVVRELSAVASKWVVSMRCSIHAAAGGKGDAPPCFKDRAIAPLWSCLACLVHKLGCACTAAHPVLRAVHLPCGSHPAARSPVSRTTRQFNRLHAG